MVLQEYKPGYFTGEKSIKNDAGRWVEGYYTHDEIEKEISCILVGPMFGIEAGYVVMGLR